MLLDNEALEKAVIARKMYRVHTPTGIYNQDDCDRIFLRTYLEAAKPPAPVCEGEEIDLTQYKVLDVNGELYFSKSAVEMIIEKAKKLRTAMQPSGGDEVVARTLKIYGLTLKDIQIQKHWFENKTGKTVTEFWKEAFEAGVKQALQSRWDL